MLFSKTFKCTSSLFKYNECPAEKFYSRIKGYIVGNVGRKDKPGGDASNITTPGGPEAQLDNRQNRSGGNLEVGVIILYIASRVIMLLRPSN